MCAVLVLAAFICACERPFVEPDRPTLEVVEPDFTTIFSVNTITLVVRANAFRTVESVTVDGQPLVYDEDEQVWVDEVPLRSGLNRLILTVTDSDGQTSRDTAYAYHAPLSVTRNAPSLPDSRGGHSATLLQDQSILVVGGSGTFGVAARGDGALLERGAATFRAIGGRMQTGRVGHTATLLPDGRVLILGGSRNFVIDAVGDLVETVEIYDPEADRFSTIPFEGAPIRRAFHSAVLRLDAEDVVLDLFGGEGDIQYTPSPLLGTRQDVRSFVFRNDSLIALSPAPGPNLGFPMAGHTQTPLTRMPTGRPGEMLIAGTYFGPHETVDVGALIDYQAPGGLSPRQTGSMIVRRTQHAASLVRQGRVIVFGGHQGSPISAVGAVELYVQEADRFFRYPESSLILKRFGLTATILPDQRILFLGGFAPTGEGVVHAEIFQSATP